MVSSHYSANQFQECVWGVAYKIAEDKVEEVRKHLDFREKGGYEAVPVTFHPETSTWQNSSLTFTLAQRKILII